MGVWGVGMGWDGEGGIKRLAQLQTSASLHYINK